MAEIWIRTDEAEDVAGSIRQIVRMVNYVGDDAQAWKWAVIALHSALQGACVCHLTTTAVPLGAVKKENADEWSTYFNESRTNPDAKVPETRLMNLPDLLKAIRKPHSAGNGDAPSGIGINSSELNWMRRFHKNIRNQFTHFEPMSWAVEVSGVPETAKLAARIIKEILEVGWAFRHLPLVQREEMMQNLDLLEKLDWSAPPLTPAP